jgi:hypothetical protein
MLLIKLMGGLGNQLFQIFTLISVSIDNGVDFKIFEYKDDMEKRNTFWDTLFKNIYDKTFKNINGPIYQYNENGFHYTAFPKIRDKSNNYSLFGYFQSYKYFQNNLKEILDLLKWHEIKKPYENKYDYKNTVSLHFRIGDYINIQTHHPILPIHYYKNALDRLIVDTGKNDWNILYFYEKNDKDIVDRSINELKNKYPNLYFTEINHYLDDWEQMICMTFCSHNIIANSTFSWWGAYLNENDNHVYYPDIWFGSAMGDKNLNDLFLNDWHKVTCNEISDSIKIKFLCGSASNSQCLENYMNVYDIKNRKYKNIEFVDDNTYTHLVIIGDLTQENTKYITDRNISSNNIIGFSGEPYEFHLIPNSFCKPIDVYSINKYVSEYFIGNKSYLINSSVFKNGYQFQWHTWKKNLTKRIDKKYKMSIILSFKKSMNGHAYRHILVDEILKTDMDIHIYGNGSEEHGKDKRIKGVFGELEPYKDYQYHICIENITDTEYNITEKITNCFVSNTIPIYYGAEKVNEIFGNNCCHKLTGDISKDMELITDIYNNSDKYTLNLNQSQHELFNGRGSLPEFLYKKFNNIKGFYINLESRKDRLKHINNNIQKYDFFKGLKRFNAIKNVDGAIGCTMSHLKCLELCQKMNEEYYLIIEDDLFILNENNFLHFVKDFETIENDKKWDIIVLTPRGDTQNEKIGKFKRINNNQTATGYVIRNHMLQILIDNFKEALELLCKGVHPYISALDQYWKKLQDNYNFYYYSDIFAGQLVNYSDIEKRYVNYNDRFIHQSQY